MRAALGNRGDTRSGPLSCRLFVWFLPRAQPNNLRLTFNVKQVRWQLASSPSSPTWCCIYLSCATTREREYSRTTTTAAAAAAVVGRSQAAKDSTARAKIDGVDRQQPASNTATAATPAAVSILFMSLLMYRHHSWGIKTGTTHHACGKQQAVHTRHLIVESKEEHACRR